MLEFFAHLPEPKRDPLLEDDTDFLREYIKTINSEEHIFPEYKSQSIYDNRPELPSFYEAPEEFIPGLPRDIHHSSIRAPFYSSNPHQNTGWSHNVKSPITEPLSVGSEEQSVVVEPGKSKWVNANRNKEKSGSRDEQTKSGRIRFENGNENEKKPEYNRTILEYNEEEEENLTKVKRVENPKKTESKKVYTKLIDIEPIYSSLNYTIVNKTRSNVVVKIPASSDDPFELTEDEIRATISEIKKLKLDSKYSFPVVGGNSSDNVVVMGNSGGERKSGDREDREDSGKTEETEKTEGGDLNVGIVNETKKFDEKTEKKEDQIKLESKPHPLEFPDHPQHEDFAEEERQFKIYLQEVRFF